MANIPQYQTQFDRQSVELGAPKQALNIPATAFGSDGKAFQEAGKGLQDAGTVLAAVRTRMNEEKAVADANTALSELIDATAPYEAQVAASKGEAAIGVTQGMREHIRGVAEGIGGKLSGGAREVFDRAVEGHYREKIAATSKHEAAQLQEYRFTAADALAVREAQSALTNFNNAELFNTGLARAVEKKLEALAVKGFGADSAQAQQAISAFQSLAVRERAQTYLNRGAYAEARDIAVNDKRLLPGDREALDKAIRPLATLGKAQEVYDRLKSMGEGAVKVIEADKTLDPDVRQKALEMVEHNVSRQRAAIQFNQHQTAITLAGRVETAVRQGDVAGAMKIRDTAPVWARPGLSEMLTKASSGAMTPDEGGPSGLVWELRRKAAENPAAFMDDWSKNRTSYSARLSAHSQSLFDNLFTAAHKGDGKPMEELLSDQELLKNTAKQLGISTKDGSSKADAEKMGKLEREYTRVIEDAMRAKGGKLSSAEKQAVIDKQILLPGTVEGLMYGRSQQTAFGAKMKGDTTFKPDTPQAPPKPSKNIPGLFFNHAANAWGVEDSAGRFRPYLGGK